jgi:hypothetical protein
MSARVAIGNLFSLLVGGLLALILAPLVVQSTHMLQQWYDVAHPPSTAKLVFAERSGEVLRLQMEITRHRDCGFIRLMGFSGAPGATLQAASIVRREDGGEPQNYPAGVTAISRVWILSPVYGSRVVLYAYYDCDGETVRARLVDEVIS